MGKKSFDKITKTIWFNIGKTINPYYSKQLPLTFKGDISKNREMLFRFVRIIHGIYIILIPVALVVLRFVKIPDSQGKMQFTSIIVLFYIMSILFTLLGYKWLRIYKWLGKFRFFISPFAFAIYDVHWTLFVFHTSRINLYLTINFLAFILGWTGISYWIVIPLFILSGLDLTLTYPTDKKWAKWANLMPPPNE